MEYDSVLSLLSSKFIKDYPLSAYPELMYKLERPYTCLLIESYADYFICVPFRSYIKHKNAYLFTNTSRSKKTKSGLDYSKIVLVKDSVYLDTTKTAIVDQDEYTEMIKNLPTIVQSASDYVTAYIRHISGTSLLHPREFSRKYQYSTLPYIHDIMGIESNKSLL